MMTWQWCYDLPNPKEYASDWLNTAIANYLKIIFK